jgi:arabinose-5-phosphate isomerase
MRCLYLQPDATFTQLVMQMSEGKLGMVIVGTADECFGVITDGDLRRGLVKYGYQSFAYYGDYEPAPILMNEDELVYDAEA